MKYIVAVLLCLAASSALATDKGKPPPKAPGTIPAVGPVSTAAAAATAAATSGSTSAADSASNGTAASSTGDIALNTGSGDARALSLFLPPLAFVPPMAPMTGCAPDVTQQALGVAWGALSSAGSHADTQDCVLMELRNAKVAACQYASAKQVEDLMLRKKLPDFVPSTVQFTDYDPRECAMLKAPPPPPVPPVLFNTQAPTPAPITACEPAQEKAKPTNVKRAAVVAAPTTCQPAKPKG